MSSSIREGSRTLFLDRLSGALLRTRRTDTSDFAVLFFDIDGFKVVNDSLGHATGDRLLVQVAERLLGHLRESDTAARFGGDELIVPRSAELVRTIVLMGSNLGLDLIAEGIETVSQRDRRHRLGCTYGQGYLFSRPVPAAGAELVAADMQRQVAGTGTEVGVQTA